MIWLLDYSLDSLSSNICLSKNNRYKQHDPEVDSLIWHLSPLLYFGFIFRLCFLIWPSGSCTCGYEGLSSLFSPTDLTHDLPCSSFMHNRVHPTQSVTKYNQAYCIVTDNDVVCDDVLRSFSAISSFLTSVSVMWDILWFLPSDLIMTSGSTEALEDFLSTFKSRWRGRWGSVEKIKVTKKMLFLLTTIDC